MYDFLLDVTCEIGTEIGGNTWLILLIQYVGAIVLTSQCLNWWISNKVFSVIIIISCASKR
jgi:hypothetical protein